MFYKSYCAKMRTVVMKHPEHTTRYVTITEDEYESLQRTIEVITDSELMEHLKKSKEDIKEG